MQFPVTHSVLDTLQALEQAPSALKVCEVFRRCAEDYGYVHFLCSAPPRLDEDPYDPLLFERWPREWLDRYVGRNYLANDPMVRTLFTTPYPFTWQEVMKRGDHSRAAHLVMSEAADFGMREGFVVPIYGLGGHAHVLTMSGSQVRADAAARAELYLVSMYAYARAKQLTRRADPFIPLSRRQAEALQWVAMGKTDSEIGDIMTISESTAHKHIEAAKRRFGVSTRMQAVVAAIRQGRIRI